jgi:plasmid stabilization system protein ParE
MRVRYTRRAQQNLADIARYLNDHNPPAALRVRAAIEDSLKLLISFPQAGRRQTSPGVRKLVTRKYPYLVYYTLDDNADEIIILSIRHPARRREHEDR